MNGNNRPEQWGTRLGFILATMGSAVGLGNVWRFPTTVVRNGGGAFIAVYLLIILAVGVPIMIAELALGRASQRNVVATYGALGPGGRWRFAGTVSLTTAFIILSFYAVIAGWTFVYLLASASGDLAGRSPEALERTFAALTTRPLVAVPATAAFMAATVAVVSGGITRGIERVNWVLMPAIVVLLTILAVRALLLPGGVAGAVWLLTPRPELVTLRVGLEALGQVFFSFSLGMGAVLTYGSYLPRTANIPQSAIMVSLADLGVALLSALIVIPALFSFGIEPGVGPGLLFVTLPSVFQAMPGADVWSTLFFAMLGAAALSSSVSMLEVVVAHVVDERGLDRMTASVVVGGGAFLVSLPSALSGAALATADFVASSVLLPVGGLLTVLFVGWVWGARTARAEVELGAAGTWLLGVWTVLIRYVIPLAIAYVFVSGIRG